MIPMYNLNTGADSANAPLLNSSYAAVPVQGTAAVPVTAVPATGAIPVTNQFPVATAQPVSTIPVVPAQGVATAVPVAPVNPNHLEALMQFPAVRVVENINLWEVMTDYNATKKFAIFLTNEDGEITPNQVPFFNAYEESECCSRQCCGNNREFDMNLVGPDGNLLVRMYRPFTCQFFCLNTPEMHIMDQNNEPCGMVKNVFKWCDHTYFVTNEKGEECMSINGACCQPGNFCFAPCEPCNEIVFNVTNLRTGTEGAIKKKWDTWARSLFTNADTFTLTFPPGSNLHERILLLAATFLINIQYFNQDNNNNNHHNNNNNDSYGSGFGDGIAIGGLGGLAAFAGFGGGGSSGGSSGGYSADFGGFDGGGFDGGDVDFGGFDDSFV